MPSEFEQEMLCVQDPIDRIRACTGRVKAVNRDERTLRRIVSKYDLVSIDVDEKFKEAKRESCDLILDAIEQCRGSGINHSVEIVEAIIDARAGEERHYRDCYDVRPARKKRRR